METSISSSRNLEDHLLSFEKSIRYVCNIKEPEVACDDQLAYEAIFNIYNTLANEKFLAANTNWDALIRYEFDRFIVNVLFYLSEISNDLKSDRVDTAEKAPHADTDSNERRISILEYSIHIVYLITNMQFKNEILSLFSLNLIEHKLFDTLVSFYKNPKVLRLKSFLKEYHDLMLEITGIIRNLTENFQLEKKNVKSIKLEQALKELRPKHRYFQYMIDEIVLNINRKSLVESLVYLKTFKDASRIIDNKYAYNDLLFISKIVNKPLFNQHKLFIDFGAEKLFSSILAKLYDLRGELDFKKVKMQLTDAKIITSTWIFFESSLSKKLISLNVFVMLLNILAHLIKKIDF